MQDKPHIPQWVTDWSLIVAIVVLLVSFVNYGMSFLYPTPEYEDFCGHERHATLAPAEVTTQDACLTAGGKWNAYDSPREITTRMATSNETIMVAGNCDRDYFCRQEFTAANTLHDRNGLLVMLIIGLIISLFGFARRQRSVTTTALGISGIVIIISGLLRYWTSAGDWAQFILLGALAATFVYLALIRDHT